GKQHDVGAFRTTAKAEIGFDLDRAPGFFEALGDFFADWDRAALLAIDVVADEAHFYWLAIGHLTLLLDLHMKDTKTVKRYSVGARTPGPGAQNAGPVERARAQL